MNEPNIPYVPYGQGGQNGYHQTPNSTETLVLGIMSIMFCWCWGILSIILSIITLVLAAEGEKQYRLNPGMYSQASYRNLKTGKTCAIIGLCLAALTLVSFILYFVIFGSMFFNMMNVGQDW